VPHPALAGLLSVSKPGQIWPPKRIGEWYVVVRLEKFFPAQLDDATKERLIDEMFQTWMREQLQKSPVSIPSADTIAVSAQTVPPQNVAAIPLNRDDITQSQANASSPIESQTPLAAQTSSTIEALSQSETSRQKTAEDPWH